MLEKCYFQTEGGGLGVYPIVPDKADHELLQKDFETIGDLGAKVRFQCFLNEQARIPDAPGTGPVEVWMRP